MCMRLRHLIQRYPLAHFQVLDEVARNAFPPRQRSWFEGVDPVVRLATLDASNAGLFPDQRQHLCDV